jgi:hypothetical protein
LILNIPKSPLPQMHVRFVCLLLIVSAQWMSYFYVYLFVEWQPPPPSGPLITHYHALSSIIMNTCVFKLATWIMTWTLLKSLIWV